MLRSVLALALASGASAFVQPALRASSKLATSKVAPAQMMLAGLVDILLATPEQS